MSNVFDFIYIINHNQKKKKSGHPICIILFYFLYQKKKIILFLEVFQNLYLNPKPTSWDLIRVLHENVFIKSKLQPLFFC